MSPDCVFLAKAWKHLYFTSCCLYQLYYCREGWKMTTWMAECPLVLLGSHQEGLTLFPIIRPLEWGGACCREASTRHGPLYRRAASRYWIYNFSYKMSIVAPKTWLCHTYSLPTPPSQDVCFVFICHSYDRRHTKYLLNDLGNFWGYTL